MLTNYNPFKKKEKTLLKTRHGIINKKHSMGATYITNRTPQHVFKKYRAFATSITEIETCKENDVKWILILYHNHKGETTPHRIKIEELDEEKTYTHEGDEQIIIPISKMQTLKERWK